MSVDGWKAEQIPYKWQKSCAPNVSRIEFGGIIWVLGILLQARRHRHLVLCSPKLPYASQPQYFAVITVIMRLVLYLTPPSFRSLSISDA